MQHVSLHVACSVFMIWFQFDWLMQLDNLFARFKRLLSLQL